MFKKQLYQNTTGQLIGLVFLFLLQSVNLFAIQYEAKAYYFETGNGGRIYCKIESEQNRTVTINNVITTSRGDNFLRVNKHYRVDQGAKDDLEIPSSVTLMYLSDIEEKNTLKNLGVYYVVGIDNESMANCKSLTSITLPNSIKKIGSKAFQGCTNLKTINLPATLEKVEVDFVDGCNSLESINIKDGNNLKYYSLDGILCYNGEMILCPLGYRNEVIIPSSIKAVRAGVFANHEQIFSVTINSGVSIKDGAFKNCSNLNKLTLNNGIREIANEAFKDCVSLEYVNIPGSVKSIEGNAFKGCLALVSVTFNEGLNYINYSAFQDCLLLRKVHFPKSLKTIYSEAFMGCSELSEVTFSEGCLCDHIGNSAFNFCTSIAQIKFPAAMKTIGEKAFMGCTALETVVLNPQIQELCRYSFFGCTNLSSIKVPAKTKVYEETFMYCNLLQGM